MINMKSFNNFVYKEHVCIGIKAGTETVRSRLLVAKNDTLGQTLLAGEQSAILHYMKLLSLSLLSNIVRQTLTGVH